MTWGGAHCRVFGRYRPTSHASMVPLLRWVSLSTAPLDGVYNVLYGVSLWLRVLLRVGG
jgi:hypothetical protein